MIYGLGVTRIVEWVKPVPLHHQTHQILLSIVPTSPSPSNFCRPSRSRLSWSSSTTALFSGTKSVSSKTEQNASSACRAQRDTAQPADGDNSLRSGNSPRCRAARQSLHAKSRCIDGRRWCGFPAMSPGNHYRAVDLCQGSYYQALPWSSAALVDILEMAQQLDAKSRACGCWSLRP